MVGSNLCLMNRIHIFRVSQDTNETQGHWNGKMAKTSWGVTFLQKSFPQIRKSYIEKKKSFVTETRWVYIFETLVWKKSFCLWRKSGGFWFFSRYEVKKKLKRKALLHKVTDKSAKAHYEFLCCICMFYGQDCSSCLHTYFGHCAKFHQAISEKKSRV